MSDVELDRAAEVLGAMTGGEWTAHHDGRWYPPFIVEGTHGNAITSSAGVNDPDDATADLEGIAFWCSEDVRNAYQAVARHLDAISKGATPSESTPAVLDTLRAAIRRALGEP